ncbi:MAG: serine hydrolase domain-containing protein [Verrucomicrobiales bacterium]
MDPNEIERLFDKNFEERHELGASVSIWKNGEEILSLHRGWQDRERTRPWQADTVAPVWSATKGPAALAVLTALHETGTSLHGPVSKVWPELKAARDSRLTFAQLLSHQAGLPALSPDNRSSMLSHADVREALENQEPFWNPGSAHGYHPRTIGFLLDEVVRRVTGGTSLGDYWNERIATPLKLDFRIGNLPASAMTRTAAVYPPRFQRPSDEEMPFYRALAQPDSLSQAAFSSPGGMRALSDINKLEYLQAGLPALGGVGSASGLAKFYHILANGGLLDGVRAIPENVVESARSLQTAGADLTLVIPTAFTAGLMRDPVAANGEKIRRLFGPSQSAFGQPGAGGSHAFADPEHGIAFSYVMNQMQAGVLPNRKSLDIVEAMYR